MEEGWREASILVNKEEVCICVFTGDDRAGLLDTAVFRNHLVGADTKHDAKGVVKYRREEEGVKERTTGGWI